MYKTLFVISILFLSINLNAQTNQEEKTKKNQINIGYFNAFSLTSVNDFGIGYKRTIKNGELRFSTSFYYNSSKIEYPDDSYFYTTTTNRVRSRLGYQLHQDYNKLQLFYGLDFIGLIENVNSERVDVDLPQNDYTSKQFTLGSGISPFIGIKYQINKSISISTETSFDVSFSKTNRKNSGSSTTSLSLSETKQLTAKLSPLGIFSINVHF